MVVEELTYIAIDYGTTVVSRRLRKRSARGGEGIGEEGRQSPADGSTSVE